MRTRHTVWLGMLALMGCPTPPTEPAVVAPAPVLGTPQQVVPSADLPPEVVPQAANNNLAIEEHDGRLFLAFRSAPDHFASEEAEMFVVSAPLEEPDSWRFEGRFALGTDVREPQLLSWGGELRLYLALLGTNPLAFEPQGSQTAVYRGPGDWTELVPIFPEDFIPWRVRVDQGRPHVMGYTGGAGVYDFSGDPLEVHWLASDDGLAWEPAVPDQPVVHIGGGSETDWVVREDGSVVAVVRNEAGDQDGFGSKVCRAEAGSPAEWTCAPDPRKYDSPLLFEEAGGVWLVGRRNVTADGHYDLNRAELTREQQYLAYQVDYWDQPKRCALWRIDPTALTATWVLDLPSRGDTCFPDARRVAPGRWELFNYSSPYQDPEADDIGWRDGQRGETVIYRIELVW